MGPVGSGKSTGCVVEVLNRCAQQAPNDQGVRRSRWAIIRNTYPQLKTTTIKTWQEWVPAAICPITFGSPIVGKLKFPVTIDGVADGTTVDAEIFFVALNNPRDVQKLLSLELTGAWINEVREVPKFIVDGVDSRLGRFPNEQGIPLTWTGLICDTNPPHVRSWYYEFAEKRKPDGWTFYRQPGALLRRPSGQYVVNPAAEGVQYQQLGYKYWFSMLPGKSPEWIKSYVLGEYASVFDGKPVYQELYSDALHLARAPIGLYRGLPLLLGWDFGLTPAVVIAQVTPRGRLNVLRSLSCRRGGIRQFVLETVKPCLMRDFPGLRYHGWGDPAGQQGSQVDEVTCIDELNRLGFPTYAAATNDFAARRDAVNNFLSYILQDCQAALLLDPACVDLRDGFLGGYHYRRVQTLDIEARYQEAPNKNEYSHIHDALQYLCLGASGQGRQYETDKAVMPVQAPTWGGYV